MRSAFRSFGIRTPELAMVLVLLCAISTAATTDRILHDFSAQERGSMPYGLVSDSDGNLFGTTLSGGDNCGTVFELAPKAGEGWSETVLHSFGFGEDGCGPWLILMDAQGNIYGTTVSGGTQDNGTAFRMSQNSNGSWTETVLYDFDFQSGDGNPTGALVMDAAGNLYGAMSNYGQSQYSVFELTPSGASWTRTILYTFPAGTTSNVSIPGLALDSSGDIYGTLTNAVSATQGLVFKLTQSAGGWAETTLFTFAGGDSGGVPNGGLLLANGDLFGTTLNGGTGTCPGEIPGCGVVFKLIPGSSGWTEKVLYSFPAKGALYQIYPSLSFFDSAGNLYGLVEGGSATFGSVFQLTPNGNGSWKETDLFDFEAGTDGEFPQAIVLGNAEQIYGTNWGGIFPTLGKIFELKSDSAPGGRWKASILYSFPTTDGQSPTGSLVADAAGNFYGTTLYGGADNMGSVFQVSPAGKESMIYSFGSGSTSTYGSKGPSPLISDGQGNFYGTTEFAGANQVGSVFELSTTSGGWQYTDLYSFVNADTEPIGGVVFDKHGNIYGVTHQNGKNDFGAVFELTKNSSGIWQERAIYNFEGYPSDGANPVGGLTIDAAGNLYGTTEHGGAGTCTLERKRVGCGTAFELSFSGTVWIETVLHSFLGVAGGDGASPMTNLILDKSGNLYGTTLTGGLRNSVDCPSFGEGAGCGTVFELSASASGWIETILYEFLGTADGVFPSGPVLWDQSGNLYGVVEELAGHDSGAVFKLSLGADGSWTESLIYSFGATKSDGMYPVGGLIFGASGNLYGVTLDGGLGGGPGHSGQGTVFEVKP